MCRELVAKVLNMFKKFMRILSPKYFARPSRDCRATVARRSCKCREPSAKFWPINNAKFSRHSYECRASVARRSRAVYLYQLSVQLTLQLTIYIDFHSPFLTMLHTKFGLIGQAVSETEMLSIMVIYIIYMYIVQGRGQTTP